MVFSLPGHHRSVYFPPISKTPPKSWPFIFGGSLQDYPQMIPVIRHAEIHSRGRDAEGAIRSPQRRDGGLAPAIVITWVITEFIGANEQ